MAINIGNKKCQLHIGNTKVSKIYLGSTKIYSSGSICTYICDDDTYQEEVDEGASCLSPKTFIPVKSGWEFVGWRQDTAANGSVLSSLAMGDAPITLYAVFRQTITLSYNGNSATSGSTAAQTGYRYYNNGNMANPSFTLSANGFSRTSYTFTKWALGSASGTQYAAGANVTLAASTTMYAVWAYSGNPFYIVQNSICKQALTWKATANSNTSNSYTYNFTVGSYNPHVGSTKLNDTKDGSVTVVSSNFDTKSNQTLHIKGYFSDGGGYLSIAGTYKKYDFIKGGTPVNFDLTVNISAVSTISITAHATGFAYNGDPQIHFSEIYLY